MSVCAAVSTLVIVACGATSTTESLTGPGPAKCGVTLAAPADPIDANGGTGTLAVTTDPECAWTATAEAGWISEVAPANGQGTGQVQFRVGPNPNGTARDGGININNQRAIIRQAAASCQIQSTIDTAHFAAAGGVATIAVTAPGGCAWAASSGAAWISVTPASGSGAGAVSVTVAQNFVAARAGTITVGGVDISLGQDAAPAAPPPPPGCTISLQPPSVSMPAAGGQGSVAITTNAGCTWTATSQAPWITITPPVSGSGSGSKAFTVAANTTTTARSGSITVGGATFTVNQAGTAAPPCAPSITPTSQSIGAAGGAGTPIAVTAATGCAWTATSSAAWLTIASGASGTGNGTVTFTVGANTSASRTGTLTIAGQTFTVNQAAAAAPPCAPSINPTSQAIGAAGGAGTPVAVTASTGCAWTAASNAAWLTIASGASGTGNGTVTFTVGANTSVSRTGTLTIAGQVFTVNQAAACTYSINPTSQTIGDDGGVGGPVAVTAPSGCAWTSTANSNWLDITSGSSGTGNGTVSFTVDNFNGSSRTGTLTIAGRTFTVTQVRCSATLTPQSQSVSALGGVFSVSMTTQTGCQWTATSNRSWITITNGTSGTGSKTVTYLVAPNVGSSRSGTLTIASQTFSVSQDDD